MPCIWGQHNSSQLFVQVAIIPDGQHKAFATASGPFGGSLHLANALLDTGATTTCLSASLAARLKMAPVGKVPIHGVGGVQYHNNYLFMVWFPYSPPAGGLVRWLPSPAAGQQQVQIYILDKVIQGAEFHGVASHFDVLLGMDVISTGSLVVQGNGGFSFSFWLCRATIVKWKASQNRKAEDRAGVIAGLEAEGDAGAAEMARIVAEGPRG